MEWILGIIGGAGALGGIGMFLKKAFKSFAVIGKLKSLVGESKEALKECKEAVTSVDAAIDELRKIMKDKVVTQEEAMIGVKIAYGALGEARECLKEVNDVKKVLQEIF